MVYRFQRNRYLCLESYHRWAPFESLNDERRSRVLNFLILDVCLGFKDRNHFSVHIFDRICNRTRHFFQVDASKVNLPAGC